MSAAPLCGDSLVRIAFLDEAGRSRGEPIIVVAGPVIHGDRTYRPLVARLQDIAQQYVPEIPSDEFFFHAKDIWHGTGKFFKDEKKWPFERRFDILEKLAKLPAEFGLPNTFGSFDKAAHGTRFKRPSGTGPKEKRLSGFIDILEHAMAFAFAEIGIDAQMMQLSRNEICMIVAEDTDTVKRALKYTHRLLRNEDGVKNDPIFSKIPGLPLRKIEDTPHFADKVDSPPLQVADLCAFLIMKRLRRREETQELFELIAPQILWSPLIGGVSVFGGVMGSEKISSGSHY